MGKAFLPPGFRFHPTDIELIMYYLKRKVMGRKVHFDAITEVNIYQFSPWDLPDMSCLKSKDLEWFFFCPREKKYASGVRVKRATENGYWKTTGRGRPVSYNGQTVGMVKTLVFHLGHSPNGTRTDWVIHEYRIVDKEVANAGHLETYTLCKVFKKSGMGPKNGAQYGAPFNEAEWSDGDGETAKINPPILETQVPNPPGAPSGSAGQLSNEAPINENDDEITHLLSHFTDDANLFADAPINQGAHVEGEKLHPSDEFDVYDLDDLDIYPHMNEDHLDLSNMYHNDNELKNSFPDSMGYIELDDLMEPLARSTEELFGRYDSDSFLQLHHEGTSLNQYAFLPSLIPPFPGGTFPAANVSGLPQAMMPSASLQGRDEFLLGSNAACESQKPAPPPQE